MGKAVKHKTREEWLLAAVEELRKYFKEYGFVLPPNIKISCSWAFDGNRTTSGETWSPNASKGKFHEIFITPKYDASEVKSILGTLIHELIHVIIGLKCGHKLPFKRAMKKLGLEGKAASSTVSDNLCKTLKEIANRLGPFPHRALQPLARPTTKQTTRLLKIGCQHCDYVVRVTRIHLDKGAPLCPIHKEPFVEM